jgi:hypothetical protein
VSPRPKKPGPTPSIGRTARRARRSKGVVPARSPPPSRHDTHVTPTAGAAAPLSLGGSGRGHRPSRAVSFPRGRRAGVPPGCQPRRQAPSRPPPTPPAGRAGSRCRAPAAYTGPGAVGAAPHDDFSTRPRLSGRRLAPAGSAAPAAWRLSSSACVRRCACPPGLRPGASSSARAGLSSRGKRFSDRPGGRPGVLRGGPTRDGALGARARISDIAPSYI